MVWIPERLRFAEQRGIDCKPSIDRLHVTSLPPCWRAITKDSSLASIVSSTNMAATSLSFESLGINCKTFLLTSKGVVEAKGRSSSSIPGRARGESTDKYWNAARQRWNYKLLGHNPTERSTDARATYMDQFVPPRTTLMEYFTTKVEYHPASSRWGS